ncbi:F-box/LRR-repeat protein 12-like isoform X2 [Ornithodoros turicata]|uniref:F-box/LRR-repeat protein 12-like isoform X2 n=1 Tax=Ornithodoros turicata TaxID=34597 RepID=UPI003139331F
MRGSCQNLGIPLDLSVLSVTSTDKNSSESDMEVLPDSILLEIFNKLPFASLCVAARVCKRWHRVSRDTSLRRVIDVTARPLRLNRVQSLIHYQVYSQLEQLYLRGFVRSVYSSGTQSQTCTITSKTLSLLRFKCPSLEVLNLHSVFLGASRGRAHINVKHFPATLKQLSLRGCRFQPTDFFQSDPSVALPLLQVLDVASCAVFSSHDLLRFAHWTSLRVLCFEDCHRIDDGGIENLGPILEGLRVVDIESTDVTDKGVTTLLTQCPRLESLFAGHTPLTGAAFLELGPSHSLCLKKVCLVRTPVSEDALVALAALAPGVTSLVGSGYRLSGSTVQKLRVLLPQCPTLRFEGCAIVTRVYFCGHIRGVSCVLK